MSHNESAPRYDVTHDVMDDAVCLVLEHKRPHVHELLLVDEAVLVQVERHDELASSLFVQAGHVNYRCHQLVEGQ